MRNTIKKDRAEATRRRLLSAIFAEAKKRGIDAGFLREEIAPNICGMRLSQARPKELMRLIEHLTGKKANAYPSSRAGLMAELQDAAKARWGEGYEKPLNGFVNSHRRAPTHFRFLSIADLKAIKERLKGMSANNSRSAEI